MPILFAIVSLQDLTIAHTYEADTTLEYNGSWIDFMYHTHIPVPETLDPQCLMATRDDATGAITLLTDPSKAAVKLASMWEQFRYQRNQRLAETDWTQLPRSPLTDEQKDTWEAYRQALRDLPSTLTEDAILHPDTITWPAKPQ